MISKAPVRFRAMKNAIDEPNQSEEATHKLEYQGLRSRSGEGRQAFSGTEEGQSQDLNRSGVGRP